MGEGHSGKFIEEGYRRARKKYNGSFFTATQSPSDYWKSETARSAFRKLLTVYLSFDKNRKP